MALLVGAADCSTGLAKRIYDAWLAEPNSGYSPDVTNPTKVDALVVAQRNQIKALAHGIAVAVVAEIVANGEAFISTSKGALQQADGADTTHPTAERSLPLR